MLCPVSCACDQQRIVVRFVQIAARSNKSSYNYLITGGEQTAVFDQRTCDWSSCCLIAAALK